MNRITTFLILIAALFASTPGFAQDVEPAPEARPSPMRLAATTAGDAYIKVVYGSPRMRDRTIFGGLVPYGDVWRTGANEATEILFTEDVYLADTRVKAGIYSLFTIPEETTWTIILNDVLGQWGAFTHDPGQDVYRIEVSSSTSDKTYEAFTMQFTDVSESGETTLQMIWENTKVDIPIRPAD